MRHNHTLQWSGFTSRVLSLLNTRAKLVGRPLNRPFWLPNRMTNPPPREIDGARVIEWAWSGSTPFGVVPGAEPPEIFGLAIATYDDCDFYRFSCDKEWNTVQDGLYASIDDAKEQLPDQYRDVVAEWFVMP